MVALLANHAGTMTLVTETLLILGAIIVGTLSAARLVRLLVIDTYPPVAWVRIKWREITNDGPWSDLVECPYCAAPWFVLPILVWGWLTDLQAAWWVFNGWLAASYLAALFVAWVTPSDAD